LDLDGVQIEVSVNSDMLETTVELWSGDCEGTPTPIDLLGTPNTDEEGNAAGQVGLGGVDGEVDVCAMVMEISGNFAADSITVNFDTEAPGVEIVRPNGVIPDPYVVDASDSLILVVDDENPDDLTCQYTVLVDCELPGQPVELYRSTSSTAIATATCETCTGDETPDAPDCNEDLPGRAVFDEQVLPQTGESAYSLHAEHIDIAANVGVSLEVNVTVDTEPGYVTIVTPTPECGYEFRTPLDPYLFDVRVSSDSKPVILTVYDGDGDETYTTTVDQVGLFYITGVELRLGTNIMRICTTDAYGQTGCTDDPDDSEDDCMYTVIDIPNVTITAPPNGALLGWKDDVDGNDANGFQRNVQVVSDVADGIEVILQIDGVERGRMSYSAPGIAFNAVTLAEGPRAIRASATDGRGEGDDVNNITVDLTPPPEVIDDLGATIISRRGGDIQLGWTAPSDGGSTVHGYDIRCNMTGIANDEAFEAAENYPFGGIPSLPDSAEIAGINDLFVGTETTYYCAVKSMDAAGNESAMSNVAVQPLRFEVLSRQGGSGMTNRFGYAVAAAGDINNDTVEDFLVGTNTQYAYIFFGDADGDISATPDVRISGISGSGFGSKLAGIGYFNNDTIPDIAIGAPQLNLSKGAVYIYLGRETWESVMDNTDADLTFIMDDPSPSTKDDGALFGITVAQAGNFDGDANGLYDVVATAFTWDANRGAAFVLLGRPVITSGTIVNIPGDGTGLVGDFMIEGFEAGGRFGVHASGVGRVNAGDMMDIVVGARDEGGTGKAHLFYGRASSGSGLSTVSASNQTLNSPAGAGGRFGMKVSGLGDIDGDVKNDLMVAAPWYNGGAGVMYIYRNSGAGNFLADPSYTIANSSSAPASDYLGWMVGMGMGFNVVTNGDINGDGVQDILFGAFRYGDGDGEGFAYFGGSLSASMTTEDAVLNFEFQGTGSGGTNDTVNYIGDFNNDGFVDMANTYSTVESNRGQV
ncbi:MAG: integrin alpha, partial [Pseudomonadota bacterium]